MKAADLLSNGSSYTIDILIFIVGVATVLLFALTRERFYLWFAAYLILEAAFLPTDLASYHFAWSYHFRTYLNVLLDAFSGTAWAFFFVEAIRPGKWRSAAFPVAMVLAGDCAVTLVLTHQIPIKWADTVYFLAATAGQVFLIAYLVRGWRGGNGYARFLLLPLVIEAVASTLNNLGYALTDLKLSPPFNIQPVAFDVLRQPFEVSLADVLNTISLLGLLAVLVYRFARTSREEHRLSAALKAAQDIQQRLVPVDVPALGGVRTQIAYRAAEEVGGDFCQILLRPDRSVFVAIGDVSGKGLQAAMLGAVAVGAIRSMAGDTIGPAAVLERLNNVLQTESIGFVTCLCLVLAYDGEMTIANAGHLSPYIDGVELALEAGLPLGILDTVRYEQMTVSLPEKARLTLLSDGVVEARAHNGELFGFSRTAEASRLSASEIAHRAHLFGQEDDITVLTLDWHCESYVAA